MDILNRKILPAIFVFSLLGMLFSTLLVQEYYIGPLSNKSASGTNILTRFSRSVCGSESSTISCERVAQSRFSAIGGRPIALNGLSFFFILTVFSVFIFFMKDTNREDFILLLFWLALAGAIADIILLCISIFIIGALCTLCMATYFMLWSVLGLLIYYHKRERRNPFLILRSIKNIITGMGKLNILKYAAFIIVILIASDGMSYGIARYFLHRKRTIIDEIKYSGIAQVLDKFYSEEEVTLQLTDNAVIGERDAPVTMVEFSDFLCPACAKTALVLDRFMEKNRGRVKLVFINFPLDINCNRSMRKQLHDGACSVARGSLCAAQQGRFEGYYKNAFSANLGHHPGIDQVRALAVNAGLTMSQFDACMVSSATENELLDQIEQAIGMGINSTPTIFINGREYKFRADERILQEIIDRELKRAD